MVSKLQNKRENIICSVRQKAVRAIEDVKINFKALTELYLLSTM